ncbi:hypothetical protein COEREDRAFT_10987 [Coemansia reversa NRRL 1564]|uniref:Uncharacterized protein n=1 Tax=Coemansia reversa (strain ATCC 12441 / NRRL 1564) TaxID=763665 RepID=A0A2G5B489_COERN|nr:hypothetical protein COEREDRAFT_10987 [Coemansia reversa NRRL 1564]|eukprot:PIA13816.1 hypothetical protein COEREDRAFT_10987 [Coemansia reversa NRRL 1564]
MELPAYVQNALDEGWADEWESTPDENYLRIVMLQVYEDCESDPDREYFMQQCALKLDYHNTLVEHRGICWISLPQYGNDQLDLPIDKNIGEVMSIFMEGDEGNYDFIVNIQKDNGEICRVERTTTLEELGISNGDNVELKFF